MMATMFSTNVYAMNPLFPEQLKTITAPGEPGYSSYLGEKYLKKRPSASDYFPPIPDSKIIDISKISPEQIRKWDEELMEKRAWRKHQEEVEARLRKQKEEEEAKLRLQRKNTAILNQAKKERERKVYTSYRTIVNVGSGKVLNVHGNKDANNTNVTLWDDDKTSGVHWKLVNKGSAYVIVPECATSRALNVYGDSAKAGLNVCLWSQTGHSTQGWILDIVNGGYVLRSENNRNLVLSADGSSNGSNVLIKAYDPSDKLQVWKNGPL